MIIKEIGNSAAYLSQSESVAHIGLGTVDLQAVYEIVVTWPPRWQNEDVCGRVPETSLSDKH